MDTQVLFQGYAECRTIMKQSGKSYYFATSLFADPAMKRSTWALYAFFRVPDDIVDEQPGVSPEELKNQLASYRAEWRETLETRQSADPKLLAIADTFARCNIPRAYGEVFLDSMALDIEKKDYQTFADLEQYMYGSAGVVGKMMAHVIGFSDERALEYAKTLGYAMQLTNFLRDIEADYAQLGRVYIPREELARFHVRVQDIAQRHWSDNFAELMRFQITRARQLYAEGNKCLPLLRADGRFAYRMASVLYERILNKLEAQGGNPFAGRASTSFAEKVCVLVKTRLTS